MKDTVIRLTATKDGYYTIKKADVIPLEQLVAQRKANKRKREAAMNKK